MNEANVVAGALLALADVTEAADAAFAAGVACTGSDGVEADEAAAETLAPNDADFVAAALALLPPRKAALAVVGLSRAIMMYRWADQDRKLPARAWRTMARSSPSATGRSSR